MNQSGEPKPAAVSRRALQAVLLAVLCQVSGCDPSDGPRDSTSTAWDVATEPAVSVGAVGSGDAVTFNQVSGVVRLSDGRIVVADGGLSSRLAILAPDGGYLGRIGRNGDGPGEYRWITSLHVGPGDSLYVFDAARQRLSVFTGDGRVARTAGFGGAGAGMLRSVMRLAGGVWVGRGLDRPHVGSVNQLIRDTIALGLLDDAFTRMKPFTHLPTNVSLTFSAGGHELFGSAPFSRMALVATWGRCIFASTAEDSTIVVYDASGKRVATIRGPGAPRAAAQEDVKAYVADRLRRASTAEDTTIAEAIGRAPHLEYLPYYSQMVVDQWGDIWLEEYSVAHVGGGRWHVISQSGGDMGVVTLPPRMGVFEITEKGVLGVTRGDFDEALVVVLPLRSRPAESAPVIPECRGAG